MKRNLLVAVFVLAGLAGVGILARQRIANIPDTVEKKYEAWAFDFRAGSVGRCANASLEYSAVLGVQLVPPRHWNVYVHLLQPVEHIIGQQLPIEASSAALNTQLRVVLTCALKSGAWDTLTIIDTAINPVKTADDNETHYVGTLYYGARFGTREVAQRMVNGADLSDFVADDQVQVYSISNMFWDVPLDVGVVDQKWFNAAVRKYQAWSDEVRRLQAEAREAKQDIAP